MAPDTGGEAAAAAHVSNTATPPAAAPATIAIGPRFASGGRVRGHWPLVALLALLLAVQSLLADRARLAADPHWRPLVERLCTALRCDLPSWREPAAFSMLERKVRAAQETPGTLRVDATFRNDARWPQAWPALQLALADADGRVIGSGVYAPEHYLGVPPDTLLAPGQSAQVTFLVQEPAPGTVAFSFRFR
ncbi:hypothetical protein B1992_04280 [Pseudoxanthomonas broegbernensis]|uniref:DUF3426 domain-containing protein n=1 Tax=Pseudoxanthomonas broegbernensis TaxID=83619 RepID=A0A7V8GNY2_9GAMM|nr:hypothetical protein B1992_04280 [Pseudoxanthomonas broegbernensis]